ncbi:hypothetical protein Hanom_Chr12g01136111 [Helianthus anomalus]
MFCFIIETRYFTDFLEKQTKFPLFLDAPDNTSCRYFIKIQSIFNSLWLYIRFR